MMQMVSLLTKYYNYEFSNVPYGAKEQRQT
jgi:hypothetical protein